MFPAILEGARRTIELQLTQRSDLVEAFQPFLDFGLWPLHELIYYDIISAQVVAEPRSIISRYLFGKNFIQ
jgi:hypothetical protein